MVSLIFTCAGVINGAAARGQEERGVTSAGLPAGLLSSPPSNEAAQHPNNNIFPPHEGSRVILWGGDGGGVLSKAYCTCRGRSNENFSFKKAPRICEGCLEDSRL